MVELEEIQPQVEMVWGVLVAVMEMVLTQEATVEAVEEVLLAQVRTEIQHKYLNLEAPEELVLLVARQDLLLHMV
jgi:hypothetical protein